MQVEALGHSLLEASEAYGSEGHYGRTRQGQQAPASGCMHACDGICSQARRWLTRDGCRLNSESGRSLSAIHVWTCLDVFGHAWNCLAMFGHAWLTSVYSWQHLNAVVVDRFQQPLKAFLAEDIKSAVVCWLTVLLPVGLTPCCALGRAQGVGYYTPGS